MNNAYYAYNLYIGSQIILPELPISNANRFDVIIKRGKVDLSEYQESTNRDCALGVLEGLAKVKIENGKTITIELLPGIDESCLSASIVNGCMAVILRQRSYFVLHASSVIIDGIVVAFVGNSGAGKSTLAAFFAEYGYEVLTDDIMAIRFQGDRCLVVPSYPQIKLRPNSVRALKCGEDIYDESLGLKFAYHLDRVNRAKENDIYYLYRIYSLAIDKYHHIDSLSLPQRFIELVKNTRAMSLLKDDLFISTHLEHCTKLMERVEIRKFYRQPGFEEFPKLIKMIEQDCTDKPTTLN